MNAIHAAVADYTGRSVYRVEVVPDPMIPRVYAVRAFVQFEGQGFETLQFLVTGVSPSKVTASDLEEVEFTAWPPTSLSRNR